MTFGILHYALAMLSGGLIGFILALAGGGGSILAVPLLLYVVGVPNPHVAIGTSAFAVAANAASALVGHAQTGSVRWRSGILFAASGVIGALAGSTLGKMIDGTRLLTLFAGLMLAVGLMMLRRSLRAGTVSVGTAPALWPRLCGYGAGSGGLAGFFGIGGGFLIVPALVTATGMPTLEAIGTSLLAVVAFGLTTSLNYAFSGLVDWPLALALIAGGVGGGAAGGALARRLALRRGGLELLLAALICSVALLMLFTLHPARG